MLYFLVDPPVAVMVIVPSVPALQEMLVDATAVTEMALGWVSVTEADTPEANEPEQLLLSETTMV